MSIIDYIAAYQIEMVAWRLDLHAYPEPAFEEIRIADFVATKLESFAIPVHRAESKPGWLVDSQMERATPSNFAPT